MKCASKWTKACKPAWKPWPTIISKVPLAILNCIKLRNGNYPASLKQIKYMSLMDSVLFDYVEYEKLDSGYALDLTSTAPSLSGERQQQIVLHYPEDFWNGLGCLRSNVK